MFMLYSEIKSIYSYRELLMQIVSRELKSKYKQSILGYFWAILNPFFQMFVMSFVFSIIMHIPTKFADNIPYSVFLYVGLLPWNLFASSINSSCGSLLSNSSLITKVYFPRSILVIATIFARIVDFIFAVSILIIYLIIYKIPINIHILWVIPIFFIQQIFTIGISFIFAAANLFYRDIQYLVSLGITLWMYLTPLVYPVELIPDKFRFIFQFNPMSVFINGYRQTLLGGKMPSFKGLIVAILLSIFILIIGLFYFKRKEGIFADNI
jgi:lipopolysaccharide transport system permease protein